MSLSMSVPPVGSVLDFDLARRHAGIDLPDFDVELDSYIDGAEGYVEDVTARQLRSATYTLTLDRFRREGIELPRPPLRRVVSITYVDAAGAVQTWDPVHYVVSAARATLARGWVRLAHGAQWPPVRGGPDAVVITFEAGYGDASEIPASLRVALLQIVAHTFANREAVHVSSTGQSAVLVPMSADARIRLYKSRPTQRWAA